MKVKPTGKHGIFGEQMTQKQARAALPILILSAQQRKTITFEELQNAIGCPDYRFHTEIFDCIITELYKLSQHHSWIHGEIHALPTIVTINGDVPCQWTNVRMSELLSVDDPLKDFEYYCLRPVFNYPHWDEVITAIIGSSKW